LLATGCANPGYSQGPPFGHIAGTPVEAGTGSGTIILADVSSDSHLDKLSVKNRRAAVKRATELGLIWPPMPASFHIPT
jgi:hypothetical protein